MNPGAHTLISPTQLARIAQAWAGTPARWLDLVRYDADRRWYLRLAHDEAHEIWLLSWFPGQRTGFHDHGASAGAFTVARGSLRERAAPGGRPEESARTLPQGAVRSFGPQYVHDVMNASPQPAVSIHAYSPPLASMRRFDIAPGGLLLVTREERSW
jgi:predicted metal-dependent enzyme (double-stranded beta helix superfamily)